MYNLKACKPLNFIKSLLCKTSAKFFFKHDLSLHRCFGIVVCKPQKPMEHEVLVFGEMEPTQPATAVIDFVHRAMKNGKK